MSNQISSPTSEPMSNQISSPTSEPMSKKPSVLSTESNKLELTFVCFCEGTDERGGRDGTYGIAYS
jgi:hypothetical protein